MDKCINTKHPEFIELAKQVNMNPLVLKSKIGVWQEKNNSDDFPTLEELGIVQEAPNLGSNNNTKEGVPELFESNPELANAVYEALGFGKDLSMTSFMPKKHWKIGHVIDNPTEAANICDNTQIRVLKHIEDTYGKTGIRSKIFAKPVAIWAKSPINDMQILHYTVAVRINGKIYLYDMPQSEFIEELSENKGKVIKEYAPRLIEYTHKNLEKYYNTSKNNLTIQDEAVLDEDILELPNQITPQQKQQAQQLYSSYLQTTNNPTIEGFKQWNNKQQQINELFESNPELANSVYEALGFKEQQYVSKLKEIAGRRKLATKSDLENSQLIKDLRVDKSQPKELKPNAADKNLASIMLYGHRYSDLSNREYIDDNLSTITNPAEMQSEAELLAYRILNDFMFDMDELVFYQDILLENPEYASVLSTNENPVKEFFENDIFEQADKEKFEITPEQKQQAQQLYSQYLEQNPNGSVEQFKNWVDEFNRKNKLFQESGSLSTISKSKIDKLQSTIEYQILNEEKDEDIDKKVGQSYIFLSEKDAQRFTNLIERNKEFPKEFKVTKKITKYERDNKNPLKFNGYNEYVDYYYIKSNKNKKSNLYDIVNKETGELIASKVRVLSVSKDSKSEIAKKYGLEYTPTKVFNANRSIAFALYRQKPSKAKYIAQAKKYLYDAIKFLNPAETGNYKFNLDKIEELLSNFPEEMWDYINTTYSPEDSTNINASISLQNKIKFDLPKLGLIQELEKITGLKLLGTSFKIYDRDGSIAKVLGSEWGDTVTIDNSMTTKELKAALRYYLKTKNIFKPSSEEENVRKYAEHRNIDYNKLRELVFGDFDDALEHILYNRSGNSDTIELSKWRQSIRNYDWQSVELFSKPYEDFQNTVKERITDKFKDKELSNGISHLEYFFNPGTFNWLNINFNNISGEYYMSDMETRADVGVETKMVGFMNPFEMKIYQQPRAGKDFLQEKEVFNRLAAILHEPFHALHALSYGTKEELELRKAFDNLYRTDFGKEMMNQVFGSGYNKGQQVSYDTLYKEFTAFATQLMLYPKQWIQATDLRSNDIYEFIEKIQTLQDKTYEEVVRTPQKMGTIEKTIIQEEQVKLSFLEKLYNYLVKALNRIIPLSKQFTSLIVDSKLVEKQVIEDVFGTVEETVTKTLKLPDNVKKSKEDFLQAMEELQSAINTLMQIDGKLFSSENVTNFFTSDKFNQETNSLSDSITQKSQEYNNANGKQDIEGFKNSKQEVARKYPRSLITSRVVPINPNMVDNSEIQYSKVESNSIKDSKVENKVYETDVLIGRFPFSIKGNNTYSVEFINNTSKESYPISVVNDLVYSLNKKNKGKERFVYNPTEKEGYYVINKTAAPTTQYFENKSENISDNLC